MNLSLRKGQEGGEKANEKLGDKIKIKVLSIFTLISQRYFPLGLCTIT